MRARERRGSYRLKCQHDIDAEQAERRKEAVNNKRVDRDNKNMSIP